MNRMILITALMISLAGKLFAQNDKEDDSWARGIVQKSKTEQTFGMANTIINIRDFVYLHSAEMVVELNRVSDFDRLKNLDSILTILRKDISFYKDSLENYPGNVSVDYVMHDDHDFREIRFKKYKPEGEMFVNKTGDVSKLKTERDTIRIIIHVCGNELSFWKKQKTMKLPNNVELYTIQVSFYLNNVLDIDKIIAEKDMLRHSIDTLQSTKSQRTVKKPFTYPTSSIYSPYSFVSKHFSTFGSIMKSNNTPTPVNLSRRKNYASLELDMGAGLVRNTIAPMGEIGLSYTIHRAYRNDDYYTYINASMTPYFFFDRNPDGQFYVKDNWFANIEIGSPGSIYGLKTNRITFGVGYLAISNGNYFKGTTMKAFLNIKLKGAVTVSPEMIFTGDLRQVFPVITVKVF